MNDRPISHTRNNLQCITFTHRSNLGQNHLMIKYVFANNLHQHFIENNFEEELISRHWRAIWITGLTEEQRDEFGVDDWSPLERAPIVRLLILHKDKYDNLSLAKLGNKAILNFMEELCGHLICRVHISPGNDIQFYPKLKHFICGSPHVKALNLWGWMHPLTQKGLENSIAEALCDTSSIEHIYMSNHTLKNVRLVGKVLGKELSTLLSMNAGRSKAEVCKRKILSCNPKIDVLPLFGWNMEGNCEPTLKALPHLITWCERAEKAIQNAEDRESYYYLQRQKLSLIYQFAQAMPILFVPTISCSKGDGKK